MRPSSRLADGPILNANDVIIICETVHQFLGSMFRRKLQNSGKSSSEFTVHRSPFTGAGCSKPHQSFLVLIVVVLVPRRNRFRRSPFTVRRVRLARRPPSRVPLWPLCVSPRAFTRFGVRSSGFGVRGLMRQTTNGNCFSRVRSVRLKRPWQRLFSAKGLGAPD